MESTAADLSSIESMLTDLVARVQRATLEVGREDREDLAAELLEVQRLLESANRRLGRLTRSL